MLACGQDTPISNVVQVDRPEHLILRDEDSILEMFDKDPAMVLVPSLRDPHKTCGQVAIVDLQLSCSFDGLSEEAVHKLNVKAYNGEHISLC